MSNYKETAQAHTRLILQFYSPTIRKELRQIGTIMPLGAVLAILIGPKGSPLRESFEATVAAMDESFAAYCTDKTKGPADDRP